MESLTFISNNPESQNDHVLQGAKDGWTNMCGQLEKLLEQ